MKWSELTLQLIRAARDEDLADRGDITARLVETPDQAIVAHVRSRAAGVICGLELGPAIVAEFGARLHAQIAFHAADGIVDGATIEPGQAVANVRGPRAAVLVAERTVLNFLCRMSGVATLTRQFVEAARRGNPAVKVLDTRKTLPGWRELDKYAVRCGGGANHRRGLYDAVLIKDNHLAGIATERLAAAVEAMVIRASGLSPRPTFVEVEVDSLEQMREVCKVAGVDMILLDNFSRERLRAAAALRDSLGLRGRVELEASGGVTLDTIMEIAATGVDRISAGAITHSAVALDLGLDF